VVQVALVVVVLAQQAALEHLVQLILEAVKVALHNLMVVLAVQALSSFHTLVAKYSQAVLLHHLVEIPYIRLLVVEA
jgi:hypothetical protein